MRTPRPKTWTLTALALAACATGPSLDPRFAVAPGDRVAIRYEDVGSTLTLRNQSSMSAEQAYSSGAGDLGLKVVDDDAMHRLLSALVEVGYFDLAGPAPVPSARATLTVERNGATWVASRQPIGSVTNDALRQFNQALTAFRAMYDNTLSYHTVRGVSGKDFERENERLLENAATRSRSGR